MTTGLGRTPNQTWRDMAKDENTIRRNGIVTKIHGGTYEIEDEDTKIKVLCTLNGKMRMHSIKLTLGDRVEFEVSVYDLTKGRVVYRHR
jgi:translation initiation factor IF-1